LHTRQDIVLNALVDDPDLPLQAQQRWIYDLRAPRLKLQHSLAHILLELHSEIEDLLAQDIDLRLESRIHLRELGLQSLELLLPLTPELGGQLYISLLPALIKRDVGLSQRSDVGLVLSPNRSIGLSALKCQIPDLRLERRDGLLLELVEPRGVPINLGLEIRANLLLLGEEFLSQRRVVQLLELTIGEDLLLEIRELHILDEVNLLLEPPDLRINPLSNRSIGLSALNFQIPDLCLQRRDGLLLELVEPRGVPINLLLERRPQLRNAGVHHLLQPRIRIPRLNFQIPDLCLQRRDGLLLELVEPRFECRHSLSETIDLLLNARLQLAVEPRHLGLEKAALLRDLVAERRDDVGISLDECRFGCIDPRNQLLPDLRQIA